MPDGELTYLTPEARARVEIDRQLAEAGWAVQDASHANLSAARGVAVREFVLAKSSLDPAPSSRRTWMQCASSSSPCEERGPVEPVGDVAGR